MNQYDALHKALKWIGEARAMNRFGPSTVCPECEQDLDGGEICQCNEEERNFQEEVQNDND